MDYIILDLGSYVNILTRQTRQSKGKPQLDWSPIQLRVANQSKVLSIGRLTQVPVEVENLRTYADFEVIDIVDDTNPYPALLGIDCVIDNETIINFKKIIFPFEDYEIRLVAPIDPLEGERYVELVNSEGQGNYLDRLYNIMSSRDDYINPIADRNLSWQSFSSCTFDSGDAIEIWKNRLHEVSMQRRAGITRSMRWVGVEGS